MGDEAKHECGIAAVSIKGDGGLMTNRAPFILYKLLLNMQGRGQLSAGITTYKKDREQIIDTYKNLGTVNEAFKTSSPMDSAAIFKRYMGNKGIGHVRYATCGKDDQSYAQPFERHHPRTWKWFSICFNGNLANFKNLKEKMKKIGYHIVRETDTEIIMMYVTKMLGKKKKPDFVKLFAGLSKEFDGAYNIALINADGDIAVVRDPLGFRPLCYGKIEDGTVVASESNALLNVGAKEIKSISPGNMILIEDGKMEIKEYRKSERTAHCMFEWVYFADVSSTIDDVSVYKVRSNLGRELAKLETEKINKDEHIIVPVPDTSKPMAHAMAYELGMPVEEGLMRNRYVGRTFIETEDSRQRRIQDKFTALREVLEGKKVILIDDSIVRGTTSKKIVQYIKEEGKAKEVHLRIACPPILCPCFYGIDMSTISELVAPKHVKDKNYENEISKEATDAIAKQIGADSLIYVTKEALVRSIGLPKERLCMACLNGQYPTPAGRKLYKKAKELWKKGKEGRTYEVC